MTEGEALGWGLVGVVGGWLVVDMIFWLTGRQTWSQFLAGRARASKKFAAWGIVILMGLATFLCWHFEFPQSLIEK